MRRQIVMSTVLTATMPVGAVCAQVRSADFDDGTAMGWQISSPQPQGFWELAIDGGNPAGFLRSRDLQGANPAGPIPELLAPDSWQFKSVGPGARLEFDVVKGWGGFGNDLSIQSRIFLLAPDGTRLNAVGDSFASTEWTTFSIDLDEHNWVPSAASVGESFDSILSKGVLVGIRGEWFWGTNEGPFEIGIDNVSLVMSTCTVDFAEPYGVLNFFDVSDFLAAYTSMDPAADLAAPFGTFNFFDVSAYMQAFGAGCP